MKPEDLNSYDWECAFEYAGDRSSGYGEPCINLCLGETCSTEPVLRSNVARIIAASDGEHDERDWLIVVELNDGRFAFLSAGCDYTGWDCQAGGSVTVAGSLPNLIQYGMTDEARSRLGLTHTPDTP